MDTDRDVGGADRWLRVAVALGLLGSGYRNRDSRPGTLAFLGGSDFLATAIIQRCPVNAPLGVDTSPGS